MKGRYQKEWEQEQDRTKDGDVFAYVVGVRPILKRRSKQMQADNSYMPSSASLDLDRPTLDERIMQLEGLVNQEYQQMRDYGFVPPTEEPIVAQQRLKKGTRRRPAPK